MERASGKRENEGEEVSTLLGGLARFSLWETFTLSGTIHTHRSTNTHMLMKQMSSGRKKKTQLRLQTRERQALTVRNICAAFFLTCGAPPQVQNRGLSV